MKSYTKIKYNCREATYLIEKKHHAHLKFTEQAKLCIHLSTCPLCRLYQSQSAVLEKFIINHFSLRKSTYYTMDKQVKIKLAELIEKNKSEKINAM